MKSGDSTAGYRNKKHREDGNLSGSAFILCKLDKLASGIGAP
jgi:hypothetical protein